MASLPKTFRKLTVQKLTTDFREAVKIETVDMCKPQDGEVCVKNRYVGVNATDINFTMGRYKDSVKLPFDCGFEGIGEVVQVGNGVSHLKKGDIVAYLSSKTNAYAEYCCIKAADGFKIPDAKPEFLVLLLSGLTASIGLDKNGRIMSGDKVLITAAAGGAGHIAIQWAKAAQCHVIGTCSSDEKAKVLKDLGCDRVINYKTEDLGEVLAKEYPEGIDVVWETIGGEVFLTCLLNLAIKGRLVVVGGITSYKDDSNVGASAEEIAALPKMLLLRSLAIQGFFLPHYKDNFPTYYKYLAEHLQTGKIKALYDMDKDRVGMEGIIDSVEYLHSGKSKGKVMVKIS